MILQKKKSMTKMEGHCGQTMKKNGMIGLYRAILSVDDFKPIGYMIIECKNSYFSENFNLFPARIKIVFTF